MNWKMSSMMIVLFWNTGKQSLFNACDYAHSAETEIRDRKKRMEEMHKLAEKDKYGEVTQISKPDFVKEVTEASKECYVVVHLFKD